MSGASLSGEASRAAPRGTVVTSALAVFATLVLGSGPAGAVPSFAQQTGEPCSACHVGAFGPQLKPFGRDFKLFGYQSTDHKSRELPLAAMVIGSATHTAANQVPPPAAHFGENDNFAIDQVSLFYAGAAPLGFGAFAQVTYSGIDRAFSLDNVDIRRVKEVSLFGRDALIGIDFNNNPTSQDVWNSAPAWGFPYNSSGLAPGAEAATLIDGGLEHAVFGGGVYGLWNNTLYAEATAYLPLDRTLAGRLGAGAGSDSDRYNGVIPYARVALLHDFATPDAPQDADQTVEIGVYGLRAERYPGGDTSAGADKLSDLAIDANYQYIGSSRHVVSAHAAYIRESQDLSASSRLFGTRARNTLSTARADVSYSFADTWTTSAQVFQTTGSFDPILYPAGLRTRGQVWEVAWTPLGKPDSPVSWANTRLSLQYVTYAQFNGDRSHARDNNTLYLNAWVALAPLGWRVQR